MDEVPVQLALIQLLVHVFNVHGRSGGAPLSRLATNRFGQIARLRSKQQERAHQDVPSVTVCRVPSGGGDGLRRGSVLPV